MKRRDFIIGATGAVGAAWIGYQGLARAMTSMLFRRCRASSQPPTRSRWARPASPPAVWPWEPARSAAGTILNQTALGVKGLSDLLLNGHDKACGFLTPPMLTEAILMWPKRSSICRATRSQS